MVKATSLVTISLWIALVGCKKDAKERDPGEPKAAPEHKAKGCGVEPGAVANWLTTMKLGVATGAEGSATADQRRTVQNNMETVVSNAGFEDWCAATKSVAKTCFEAANADRADCQTPLDQIATLRVRDRCASELAGIGAEWLVTADGVARGAPDSPEEKTFLGQAEAYRARMPQDRTAICGDGIALECYAQQTAASCVALLGKLRAALTPAP